MYSKISKSLCLYIQEDFKVKQRKNSELHPAHQCQTDIHHKENEKLLLIMPTTVLLTYFWTA